MAADSLLSPAQMAARLAIAPETLLVWTSKKKIPCVRISRKVVRFDPVQVVAHLRKIGKS